ncbi:MAG: DUF3237 family protein [Pseudomonadota bacterium]|nr:DUF3237 family protein [Pseudomonadota bacterium]
MTSAQYEMAPPGLGFAFRILLELEPGPRLRFEPAFEAGRRGFVAVLGGTIDGPRLQGRVVSHSGGDWPRLWHSGLVDFEAHYMLEAADGTPIYIHNRGLAYAPPDVLVRLESGMPVRPEETYCRVTPRFEVPAGPHDWLARTVFVGKGERHGAKSVFDYYAVT